MPLRIRRSLRRLCALAIAAAIPAAVGAQQPAQERDTAMKTNSLAAEWNRARLGMREYIDAMPEDGIGFRPTPEIRSFAEQVLHVAAANYSFAAAVSGRPNPYDPQTGEDPEKREDLKKDKAALREFVLGSYDFVTDAILPLDERELAKPVKFFRSEMPRSLLLAKALEHYAHHRGQTTIYLRLRGITPPSERLF
jgi:uncharacterized damage-inducible protein DinB